MSVREVVFVPVRRDADGGEFVDLSGAAFNIEAARRNALDAPARWSKDRPLVRVARFDLVEVGGGIREDRPSPDASFGPPAACGYTERNLCPRHGAMLRRMQANERRGNG